MKAEEQNITEPLAQTAQKSMCSTDPDSVAVIKSMVNRSIQSSIGYSSAITVECEDGVVTLRGTFASETDKNNALRAVMSNPCVRKLINEAT